MKTTRLIIVGGFLGAGKTTMLWKAAQKLMDKGLNVGLITNDQAPELVDSALLQQNNLKVAEVSGSCFCCNFNGFTDAIQKIRKEASADVIIAEPVGSCTDLSATIVQPLKQYWNSELQISPLSVMADPIRLKSILEGDNAGLHPDAAYIFRKQLEESDIILINKTELLDKTELEALKQKTKVTYPSAIVYTMSAHMETGIDNWLEDVMTCNEAGKRIVDIDYDIYANGEAVLGWLNGTIILHGENTDWDKFTHNFLINLSKKLDNENYPVGHIKVISENKNRFIVGNITGKSDTITMRGSAGQCEDIKLIINARVETTPDKLDSIVKETLSAITNNKYTENVLAWRFLQPGRPQPTYRFTEVV